VDGRIGLNTFAYPTELEWVNSADEKVVGRHYFKHALLVSLLLHVVILIYMWMHQTDQQPVDQQQIQPTKTVHVYLEPSVKPEVVDSQIAKPLQVEVAAELPVQEVKEEAVVAVENLPQVADEVPTNEPAPELELEPQPQVVITIPTQPINKPAPKLKQSVTASIKQMMQQQRLEALNTVANPPCDARQQKEEIRLCQPDDSQHWQRPQRYEGALTSAFGHLNNKGSYEKDMASVAALIERQENIDQHIATMDDVPEFIVKEQRAIANEIGGVYQKYEDGNLLKIISSGIDVTNKIIDVVKDED
jgi:hypothetical protein